MFVNFSMPQTKLCKNCNSELIGLFCSTCGQKDNELLSVKAIVRELTDNVFSFDSRFFITLKYLMIKPGFLTKEYWAGRRTTYLPPLRMYLVLSVLYFFLQGFMTEREHTMFQNSNSEAFAFNIDDSSPQFFHFIVDILNNGFIVMEERQLNDQDLLYNYIPSAMFILMPFMGLLLLLVYRNKNLFYSYHLITVLHFHCFVFFINSVEEFIPIVDSIMPLFFFYYAVSMLKVIYQDSWVKTSMKFMILLITYGASVGLTILSIIFGTIFVRGLSA